METRNERNARRMREWRQENPELAKARDKERYRLRYDRTREFLEKTKDRPCMDCGIKYPTYVMQFDHRDPKTKLFSIGKDAYRFALSKVEEEVSKCDVVCANCHAERTHRQKIAGTFIYVKSQED